MPPTFGRRMVIALALLAGITSIPLAYAGALSLESLARDQVVPSEAPALLEPIGESGRVGWKCAPERAAAATDADAAGLPSTGPSP